MGTSAASLNSNSSSAAATVAALLAPETFTGVSQYSGDLQSILTRAVQIAQLPVTIMQNQDSVVVSKIAALGTMQSSISTLAADLANLSTLAQSQALTATSSAPATLTATVNGNMTPTTYTITNITSTAAPASETSHAFFANGTTATVSASGTMQLTLGTQTANIHLTSATNNLVGLANAINNATDASGNSLPLTATIITAADNQDYLSVTANTPGRTTLTLTEGATPGGAEFLTQANQGANTDFTLNGNISVDSPSTTINNVIPGLTLNVLQKAPTGTVTVSLSSDPTQLSDALNTFVGDYNSLLNQVNGQVGASGGALSGDSIMNMVEGDMQQLVSYTGAGAIRSLSDLGITMADNSGQMTFDPTVVSGLSASQLQSAFSYLGSTTTGLASLANSFTQLSDPISGVIQSEIRGDAQTDQNLQTQISLKAVQVSQMQAALQLQLAAADASIAGLESQQNMLSTTIQAMNFTTYGYQANPGG